MAMSADLTDGTVTCALLKLDMQQEYVWYHPETLQILEATKGSFSFLGVRNWSSLSKFVVFLPPVSAVTTTIFPYIPSD